MTLLPERAPGLFGVPPGADFPKVLVEGLLARMADQPPEAVARFAQFQQKSAQTLPAAAQPGDGTTRPTASEQ